MEKIILDINNNTILNDFFIKSLGTWESHRTYMYSNGKCNYSTTVFNWNYKKEEEMFLVNWENELLNSKGTMGIKVISNNLIHRTNGYFTKNPTESSVKKINEECLRTITSYGGNTYDEKIIFINKDRRIRRTIGTSNIDSTVMLIGTYVEKRIK